MTQKKIDDVAILWNKTKNPKYKDLWYKLVKEFANGTHNIKRRIVSINPSYETNDRKHKINKQSKLF